MQTIDRSTLKSWLDERRNFVLVEVLGPDKFQNFHLPGAVNVPVGDNNFDQAIAQLVPDRNQAVVVYCYDTDCTASPKAAERMEAMGYEQVFDYEAGKMDWKNAGLPIVEQ